MASETARLAFCNWRWRRRAAIFAWLATIAATLYILKWPQVVRGDWQLAEWPPKQKCAWCAACGAPGGRRRKQRCDGVGRLRTSVRSSNKPKCEQIAPGIWPSNAPAGGSSLCAGSLHFARSVADPGIAWSPFYSSSLARMHRIPRPIDGLPPIPLGHRLPATLA